MAYSLPDLEILYYEKLQQKHLEPTLHPLFGSNLKNLKTEVSKMKGVPLCIIHTLSVL